MIVLPFLPLILQPLKPWKTPLPNLFCCCLYQFETLIQPFLPVLHHCSGNYFLCDFLACLELFVWWLKPAIFCYVFRVWSIMFLDTRNLKYILDFQYPNVTSQIFYLLLFSALSHAYIYCNFSKYFGYLISFSNPSKCWNVFYFIFTAMLIDILLPLSSWMVLLLCLSLLAKMS